LVDCLSVWRARAGSVRDEYASAEQVEVGATVALPLDQLDSCHLAFDLPGAPVSGQASDDGVLVPAEPCDQGVQRGLT
jgi:hypothetical protein